MNIFKNIGSLLLGAAFLLTLPACESNSDADPKSSRPRKERKNIGLTRNEQEIVNGHSKFAFELFRELNEDQKQHSKEFDNLIISPLSLSLDLSMLGNAIDDETFNTLLALMNIDAATSREELNELSRNLVDELVEIDTQVILNIANSIWTRPGLTVRKSFAEEVLRQYDAQCKSVAFWEKESEDIINGWAEKATNGLIKNVHMAGPAEAMTITKFCNALYFNGEWVYKFDTNKTEKMKFKNLDGTDKKVSRMNGETAVKNINYDDRSIIGLPLGNSAYHVYFILPDEDVDFDQNIAELDYEKWCESRDMMFYNNVVLSIPRFDLSCKTDMTKTLSGMGLNTTLQIPYMFEEEMGDGLGLNVTQSCNFKIEETGAEAAAVTVGEFFATSIGPIKIDTFEIDRPFALIVEEQSTGTILFMGKVVTL